MSENKQALHFNSADYPLSQFVVFDGESVTAAPDVPTEADMRLEAIKYIGRKGVETVTTAAKASGEYLFWVVTRHYPGE